jgi:IS4 transposase
VNDISPAKNIPIEPGATYVFDLGYYCYGWWARLIDAGCRIVTRFKKVTPLSVVADLPVPEGSKVLSDRIGHLPQRLKSTRKNPVDDPVREVRVLTDNGKELRILTNDLDATADEIADLYKRRWEIELFFRFIKQTLKIRHFMGTSENAVRIQVAVALIALLLVRIAQEAVKAVPSPLAFARLIRANLMHRRPLDCLHQPPPPIIGNSNQLHLELSPC